MRRNGSNVSRNNRYDIIKMITMLVYNLLSANASLTANNVGQYNF